MIKMDFSTIEKYFGDDFSSAQMEQFAALGDLYATWNSRINVISRKDIDNLYERHVQHSLAIYRFLGNLKEGTRLMDMGTGGGFPGIPLAIAYPQCPFHLIDRIGKKIRVAQEVARAIGLTNVTFQHGDIGECRGKFDFVVSRAVMRLDALVPLIRRNISRDSVNSEPNGLVCLKGGDLHEETAPVPFPVVEVPLADYYTEPFYETKKLVYVPL